MFYNLKTSLFPMTLGVGMYLLSAEWHWEHHCRVCTSWFIIVLMGNRKTFYQSLLFPNNRENVLIPVLADTPIWPLSILYIKDTSYAYHWTAISVLEFLVYHSTRNLLEYHPEWSYAQNWLFSGNMHLFTFDQVGNVFKSPFLID